MPMTPLSLPMLHSIARTHDITYELLKSRSKRGVATKMSRVYSLPQQEMYDLLADLEAHTRFLPHLKKLKVITSADIGNVLPANEVLVVEGMEEGGSKLGIKHFTLTPPDKIAGVLITDPFPVVARQQDPKRGTISWSFEEINANSSRMTVASEFIPASDQFYRREMIDHVWLDFFENTMIHVGDLTPENKLTKLFG